MNFTSFAFLLVFLPLSLIIFWMIRKNHKECAALWFLIFASVIFYAVNFTDGLLIFILSLFINFLLIRKINKSRLIAGVVFDIALLVFIKYVPLLLNISELIVLRIGDTDVTLLSLNAPGISFYTFTEIAFLVEAYRGNFSKLKAKEYVFAMTFFPKIIQGPIVSPVNMVEQLPGTKINWEKSYRAILLFCFGCFKKVIIADTLGGAVDFGFDSLSSMHTGEALIIMLSYTLQLYFDFSGYCDMAMAVASLFGFELPINFNSPYKARNIDDFWKRWHITLTGFFTKYIYFPLGGSRKGQLRTYLNILIVFLVSGLWHGAGWQFIIWGMMHGVLFVITRAVNNRQKQHASENRVVFEGFWAKTVNCLKVFLTFVYVNAAWVFFRAPSVADAFHLFKDMGECWFPRFNQNLAKCFNIDELWYIIKVLHLDRYWWSTYILMFAILILLLILVFKGKSSVEYVRECKINLFNTALIVVLAVWCLLSFEGVATYLYVNF